MRIPWWLSPWREALRQRKMAGDFAAEMSRAIKAEHMQMLEREALARKNAELDRQLRIAAGSTPAEPKVLVGWEQAGGVTPEFCLVGVDRGAAGGKRLYASRDLGGPAFGMTAMDDPPPRWKLSTVMAGMLTIDKPNYGEALAHLMTIWANWAAEARGLPARGSGTSTTRYPPGTTAVNDDRMGEILP